MNFRRSVRVLSFPRTLCGGDAVPTDGSTIALGLGDTPVESQVRLARCPRRNSDQISWMPMEMRERVLMDCMGKESYEKAQELQVAEMAAVQARRKTSLEDNKNISLMPTSFEEASQRAQKLTNEVANFSTEATRGQHISFMQAYCAADWLIYQQIERARNGEAQTSEDNNTQVEKQHVKEMETEVDRVDATRSGSSKELDKDVVICSPARARTSLPMVTCEAATTDLDEAMEFSCD